MGLKPNKAIKRMVFKLHFCHSASLHFMAKVQLKNHRFVLENVNGKAVKTATTQPEIGFSALPDISLVNNISVSGQMCNRFNGQGKLSEGELKVKTLKYFNELEAENIKGL